MQENKSGCFFSEHNVEYSCWDNKHAYMLVIVMSGAVNISLLMTDVLQSGARQSSREDSCGHEEGRVGTVSQLLTSPFTWTSSGEPIIASLTFHLN